MSEGMRTVLLVDGPAREREGLAVTLRKKVECIVLEAKNPAEALGILGTDQISLLLADLSSLGRDGFDLIKKVHRDHPAVVTIAAIPRGEQEMVVEALKLGVFFHVGAPYDLAEAVIAVARGLNFHDLQTYRESRAPKIRKSEGFHGILGKAPRMQKLFGMLDKVAEDAQSTVLVYGESGTGKELVARAIHAHSPRRGKNFVPVNCAAIPDELLESELFGYVKGAFTGATQSKIGRIQYAEGGTLFLDEIGDMKPTLQAKLLRVLQEKEFEPVGGVKPVPADVRVVAATHRNLERLVADGGFREDLYYRLSVVPITIPPLRQRVEDIPVLVEKFVQAFNRNRRECFKGFDDNAMMALLGYPWPGNVRELENLVQRMVVLHCGNRAGLSDLPPKYREHAPAVETVASESPASPDMAHSPSASVEGIPWHGSGVDFNLMVSEFEERLIFKAMEVSKGNKREAARLLNLKRTTLIEKIKKKGLDSVLG